MRRLFFSLLCATTLPYAFAQNTTTPAKDARQETPAKMDWEAHAILGWHQAGASSTQSSQHLFFDFFVARPFGKGPVYDSDVNLWGQVRIASAPQQRTIPVSQFAVDFAAELGKVQVNELAQSGEFLTGIEWRPWCHSGKGLCWKDKDRVRAVGLVAFFGANGAFSDPSTQGRVFRVPGSDSPQWANFADQFPAFKDPAFAAKAQYVGLVPPDRERFYRQYGGGIRYTSYSRKQKGEAPAMYTATIGQDQSITGGRYVRPVFKADAFYPLPLPIKGKPAFIYLFGTANLAVAKPRERTPLAMELVSSACPDGTAPADAGVKCGVKLYQNNVAVFPIASSRDTYRIGLGIDFIGVLNLWRGQ